MNSEGTGTQALRGPDQYEITLSGRLGGRWAAWFEGMSMACRDDGTTVLQGPVADQAALHGLLCRLRDIGVPLVSAVRLPPCSPALDAVLHTERLTLRPAVADDADATWRFRQLDSVNEWLGGCPSDIEGYRALFADPARLASTVIVERGGTGAGEVVGDLMLRREDSWTQVDVAEQGRGAQAELGWVVDPEHGGRGYATEAVRELLRHCFDDIGVHRVFANCFVDNTASWRLMERVGMRREGHAVRDSLHRSRGWLDTVTYAMLADEWRALRQSA